VFDGDARDLRAQLFHKSSASRRAGRYNKSKRWLTKAIYHLVASLIIGARLKQRISMARTQASFRQTDLQRAVKAALACNLPIYRTEISRDGTIVLVHTADGVVDAKSDLDRWMVKRAH